MKEYQCSDNPNDKMVYSDEPKMKDADIKELAMKLYYEEGSTLGEDIDHNVFESIFEEGYKSSFKEIAKIQNENVELKEELGGMMALNVKADKEIAELKKELEFTETALDAEIINRDNANRSLADAEEKLKIAESALIYIKYNEARGNLSKIIDKSIEALSKLKKPIDKKPLTYSGGEHGTPLMEETP